MSRTVVEQGYITERYVRRREDGICVFCPFERKLRFQTELLSVSDVRGVVHALSRSSLALCGTCGERTTSATSVDLCEPHHSSTMAYQSRTYDLRGCRWLVMDDLSILVHVLLYA